MFQKHICPFCSSPLLCHIRLGKIYWFCRHCHQEIPYGVLEDLGVDGNDARDNNLVAAGVEGNEKNFQSLEKALQQVASAIKKVQKHQCLRSINPKLEELAALDELTRLANRQYFEEYLKQQWRRMETEQEHLSLIICDIDCFEKFNEIHGEKEGDEYLQKLASVISLIVKRPNDLVARYGGEEFVILLPYTEGDGAIHVGKKIHQQIQFLTAKQNNQLKNLGVSLGITSGTPTSIVYPSVLIQKAENALKQAKRYGGNQIHFINL